MTWTTEKYLEFMRKNQAEWPFIQIKDTRFNVEIGVLNYLKDAIRRETDPAANWNMERSRAQYFPDCNTTCSELTIEYEFEDVSAIVPMARVIGIVYIFNEDNSQFGVTIYYNHKVIYQRAANEAEPTTDQTAQLIEKVFAEKLNK